jgi:hypothetical protein
MQNPDRPPLSERKRAAILRNLEKARAARRTPESYARSRYNATKHGMFAREIEPSIERLRENPRHFHHLHEMYRKSLLPRDATEALLVRRLAEASWRHIRLYWSMAQSEFDNLLLRMRFFPEFETLDEDYTYARAYALLKDHMNLWRFHKRFYVLAGEVERMLRLLLIYRTGKPRVRFHFMGRQFRTEITELSTDPGNWVRRYAACVPLKKQTTGIAKEEVRKA